VLERPLVIVVEGAQGSELGLGVRVLPAAVPVVAVKGARLGLVGPRVVIVRGVRGLGQRQRVPPVVVQVRVMHPTTEIPTVPPPSLR
jgi:hypothetical protein